MDGATDEMMGIVLDGRRPKLRSEASGLEVDSDGTSSMLVDGRTKELGIKADDTSGNEIDGADNEVDTSLSIAEDGLIVGNDIAIDGNEADKDAGASEGCSTVLANSLKDTIDGICSDVVNNWLGTNELKMSVDDRMVTSALDTIDGSSTDCVGSPDRFEMAELALLSTDISEMESGKDEPRAELGSSIERVEGRLEIDGSESSKELGTSDDGSTPIDGTDRTLGTSELKIALEGKVGSELGINVEGSKSQVTERGSVEIAKGIPELSCDKDDARDTLGCSVKDVSPRVAPVGDPEISELGINDVNSGSRDN